MLEGQNKKAKEDQTVGLQQLCHHDPIILINGYQRKGAADHFLALLPWNTTRESYA
jgi:hypothetical protein